MGSRAPGLLPAQKCLPGRPVRLADAPAPDTKHLLTQQPLYLRDIVKEINKTGAERPPKLRLAMVGMGCFWCSENVYMRLPGVYSTSVGYAGGVTRNPSYNEVCTGETNHNEVLRIVFDESRMSYRDVLRIFWQNHDPTTPNRQGNDAGSQYRSGVYYFSPEQREVALQTKDEYEKAIGGRPIVTEIVRAAGQSGRDGNPAPGLETDLGETEAERRAVADLFFEGADGDDADDAGVEFYMAEEYHQQYDARGKRQYCGLRPLGVPFPTQAGDGELAAGSGVGEACSRQKS